MDKNTLEKEISILQKKLSLTDWDISFGLLDSPGFMGELTTVDYKRFQAYLSFDSKILEEDDKTIRKVILHELCHIFTIMNLRQFSEDEHLKNILGWNNHSEIVMRMDILNEQMTVRLEKLISSFLTK